MENPTPVRKSDSARRPLEKRSMIALIVLLVLIVGLAVCAIVLTSRLGETRSERDNALLQASDLQGQVAALESSSAALTEEKDGLAAQLATLTADKTALTDQVAALSRLFDTLVRRAVVGPERVHDMLDELVDATR